MRARDIDVEIMSNPAVLRAQRMPREIDAVLSEDAMCAALDTVTSWPGYAPTPLRALPGLAAAVGVQQVWYKDEQSRFGLKSFKALGGAYAVYHVVMRFIQDRLTLSAPPTAAELLAGEYRKVTRELTVTCATDGNHGRSVAWGASLFGCRCVIFLPQDVSRRRQEAIEFFGAATRRIAGHYDAAIRAAAEAARVEGMQVVSDTSYEGYTDVPRDVMSGYGVMTAEIRGQVPGFAGITHVVLQGGVGGLAAAVVIHLWRTLGVARPTFIVVEPQAADCLFQSAVAGKRVAIEGDLHTIMAGLSCGEPSLLAWEVVARGVDFFARLADTTIPPAMRALAQGVRGDSPIVSGESGAVGVAFLQRLAENPLLKQQLGLDAGSQVLVFGTEGDTDPELYRRIVRQDA